MTSICYFHKSELQLFIYLMYLFIFIIGMQLKIKTVNQSPSFRSEDLIIAHCSHRPSQNYMKLLNRIQHSSSATEDDAIIVSKTRLVSPATLPRVARCDMREIFGILSAASVLIQPRQQ